MPLARRRALVGLLSLALVAFAQAGLATGASAATAPAPAASAAAAPAAALGFTASPAPTITGTAQVGTKLTAVTGTWTPTPGTFLYRWSRDGVAIQGATRPAYALVAADQGKRITVSVTAVKTRYPSLTRTSEPTAAVAAASTTPAPSPTPTPAPAAQPFATAPAPTITGTPAVGQPLTAVPGPWSPAPRFAYQWFAGTTPIWGATASTFTPTSAEAGATITVSVAASRDGYVTTTRMSAATAKVALGTIASSVPTIAGDVKVGSVLDARPGEWSTPLFSYVWFADDVRIPGATGSTYTPVAADLGKRITVTVTGTQAGYAPASRTSGRTPAVVAATAEPPARSTGTVIGSVYLDSVAPGNLIETGEVVPWRVGASESRITAIVDGRFRIDDLLPGEYRLNARVTVDGELIDQYYGEADGIAGGRTFTVQADGTVRLDVVLKREATISGTAVLDDGTPARGSTVEAYSVRGGLAARTWTDESGRFTLEGLQPGQYEVRTSAPFTNPEGFIGEWYRDTDDRNAATRITVGWGQDVTGIDSVLTLGSRLEGVVRTPDGAGYRDASVYLVPEAAALLGADPRSGRPVAVDAAGRFRFTTITPGRYYVHVVAVRDEAPSYASQWVGGTGSLATATVFTARRGSDLPDVDVRLAVTASVTATLTGTPALGSRDHVEVELLQDGVVKQRTFVFRGGDTGFIASVDPGTYRVRVTSQKDYVDTVRWWDRGTGADRSELVVEAGTDSRIAVTWAPAAATPRAGQPG
ncbi:carboxypeptidase regulatory-like domain-containing protein [Clavibacter michiganensis]|uniref:carboxypeptidase regulatory-like domain-containing protein n=1 Tax=Clavibacter michiganensis TaxID=28447 RepID=UPI0006901490|nr:carboxypeptidase regulatory-like domain-containing protein [Clavibacter michiganensis]